LEKVYGFLSFSAFARDNVTARPHPGVENSKSQKAMEEIYKLWQIALFLLSPSLIVQLLLDCA